MGSDKRAKEPPVRLYALDALRVLAALAVLAFHFTGIDKATPSTGTRTRGTCSRGSSR
ncbi:hypothetical protein NKH18_16620 [Streptomyces sp. M10(2022)]